MKHHKKNSKKQKLSLKYNIQKRVRVTKRRLRKEAKKLGLRSGGGSRKKDPGIPNTWPFKAEMLQELERQKEKKDEEMQKRREDAKKKSQKEQAKEKLEKRRALKERDTERRQQRLEAVEASQATVLAKVLKQAEILLVTLDARDPLGCRCAELEAWAQESGKRVIFVLTKTDLISPQLTARWLQTLGREAPAVAVQCEAGRDGVAELLLLLGIRPAAKGQDAAAEAKAVGVVGYLGTGKTTLCKALRQESRQAASAWLMPSPGRLRPTPEASAGLGASLHSVLRGLTPKGAAWSGATATAAAGDQAGPLAVAAHLLGRSQATSLMRRFRLPAFSGIEELLRAFGKDRNMKSKKGKDMAPEAVARRMLAELAQAPGACCLPREENDGGAVPMALWQSHDAAGAGATLRASMAAQVATMAGREPGPAASAVQLTSEGCGPSVDVRAIMAADGLPASAAAAAPDADDGMAEDSGSEGWESGDLEDCEEEFEGEESEEEDAAMED